MNIRPVALAATLACTAVAMPALADNDDATQSKTQAELGRVQFKTSCNAEAQTQFERALAMLRRLSWCVLAICRYEHVPRRAPMGR